MKWLKKYCTICNDKFFILSTWTSPPEICEICRVRAISDIRKKLSAYVINREKMRERPVSSEFDRCLIEKENNFIQKAKSMLRECVNDEGLIVWLVGDKDMIKLILDIEKKYKFNSKLSMRLKQQKFGKVSGPQVIKLVQGGSPGLGKKT